MKEADMWVARDLESFDGSSTLCMYEEMPVREDQQYWLADEGGYCILPDHWFPALTWEDEPVKVTGLIAEGAE